MDSLLALLQVVLIFSSLTAGQTSVDNCKLNELSFKNKCYVVSSEKAPAKTGGYKACQGRASIRPTDVNHDDLVTFLKTNMVDDMWLGLEESAPEKHWHWGYKAPIDDATVISAQGCYIDNSTDRDLPVEITSELSKVQPLICIEACKNKGFLYAGLQVGYKCFCGDSFGKYGTGMSCISDCKDSHPIGPLFRQCGGIGQNSVYSVYGIMFGEWAYNQPNNYKSYQYCAIIDRDNGYKFADEICGKQFEHICMADTRQSRPTVGACDQANQYKVGDLCLILELNQRNWFAASEWCASEYKGTLVKITSKQIHDGVKALVERNGNGNKFWTALTRIDKNGWKWTDGQNIGQSPDVTHWSPTAPSHYHQTCAVVLRSKGYLWDDVSCENEHFFLCDVNSEPGKLPNATTTAKPVIGQNCVPGIVGCYILSDRTAGSKDGSIACRGFESIKPSQFIFDELASFLKRLEVRGLWMGLEKKEPLNTWYWQSTLNFDAEPTTDMIAAQGCWKDLASDRDLPNEITKDLEKTVLPTTCMAGCKSRDFRYAGVQAGNRCFCGNEYGKHGLSRSCVSPCRPSVSTDPFGMFCGGKNENHVFDVNGGMQGHWGTSEPSNYNNNQYCGVVHADLGYNLADEQCFKQFMFLCAYDIDETYGGCSEHSHSRVGSQCLFIERKPRSWIDAAEWCMVQHQAELVRITTKEVQGAVEALIESHGTDVRYWIGLTRLDKHGWEWTTGSNAGQDTRYIANWAPDTPSHPDHNCAIISRDKDYLLADVDCSSKHHFLCKDPDFDNGGFFNPAEGKDISSGVSLSMILSSTTSLPASMKGARSGVSVSLDVSHRITEFMNHTGLSTSALIVLLIAAALCFVLIIILIVLIKKRKKEERSGIAYFYKAERSYSKELQN